MGARMIRFIPIMTTFFFSISNVFIGSIPAGFAESVLVSKEKPAAPQSAAPVFKEKESSHPIPLVLTGSEAPSESGVKMVVKTISGAVSGHGYNGLAVTYNEDTKRGIAYEAWFNYEDDLKIGGYRSKKEIEDGDSVEITYELPQQGGKKVLKQIRLLKKRPRVVQQAEAGVLEDSSANQVMKGKK